MKETACVWLASPISSRLCSRQLRKACRLLKKTQLALVWFSAKPCLFKFVLGALRGQPTFNLAHMGFLEPAPCSANKHMPCFLSLEERKSGVWGGGGRSATKILSPGTQQPHWELDSFPASSGLRDFLRKYLPGPPCGEGSDCGVIS